jgi:hypothetical protein
MTIYYQFVKSKLISIDRPALHRIEKIEIQLEFYRNMLEDNPGDLVCKKRIASYETEMAKLKKHPVYNIHYAVSGNGNNMAVAYLDQLPKEAPLINLSINGCYGIANYSITEIPDLSRFTNLKELIFDGHAGLCEGLERIPANIKAISLLGTGFYSVAGLARFKDVEYLDLTRMRNLQKLPDLTGLARLETLNMREIRIRTMPKLPFTLKIVGFTYTSAFLGILTYKQGESVVIRLYNNRGIPIDEFVKRVNQRHEFDNMREALLELASRISMSPTRIARILDSGEVGISGLCDLYEYQSPR